MNLIRSRLPLILFLAVVLIIQQYQIPEAQASSIDVHVKVTEAFTIIREAELAGGDVTRLVDKLNTAVGLISQGDLVASSDLSRAQDLYRQAEETVNQVIMEAPSIREEGVLAQRNSSILLGSELALLAVLGLVIYKFGPRLLWSLWLRVHRDWKVRI